MFHRGIHRTDDVTVHSICLVSYSLTWRYVLQMSVEETILVVVTVRSGVEHVLMTFSYVLIDTQFIISFIFHLL